MSMSMSMSALPTFWYSRYNVADIEWLLSSISALNRNTWPADRPLLLNGSVWSDQFSEQAVVSLMDALKDNTSCTSLIIRSVTMDLKAQKAFDDVLMCNKSLVSISIDRSPGANAGTVGTANAGTGPRPGPCAGIPLSFFRAKSTMRELSLANCTLNRAACKALGRMLCKTRSLVSLKLVKVDLKREGIAPLVAALRQCQSLRNLTLDSMQLGAKELQDFLQAAAANTSLSTLSLVKMGLNETAAPMIALLLRENKLLTKLSLCKNDLNGDAIKVICRDGLIRNRTLTTLKLSCNPVGDDGARHLIAALCQNTQLADLCLTRTEIWRPGCLAFCRALPQFTGLRKLALDGNEINELSNEILSALAKNMVLYQIVEGMPALLSSKDETSAAVWTQVDLLLRMNKANRRLFVEPNVSANLLPLALWSATRQPEVLYSLLRGMPHVLLTVPKAERQSLCKPVEAAAPTWVAEASILRVVGPARTA